MLAGAVLSGSLVVEELRESVALPYHLYLPLGPPWSHKVLRVGRRGKLFSLSWISERGWVVCLFVFCFEFPRMLSNKNRVNLRIPTLGSYWYIRLHLA